MTSSHMYSVEVSSHNHKKSSLIQVKVRRHQTIEKLCQAHLELNTVTLTAERKLKKISETAFYPVS